MDAPESQATRDRPCDYTGCPNAGTRIWRNAINLYCDDHFKQFLQAEVRIAQLIELTDHPWRITDEAGR